MQNSVSITSTPACPSPASESGTEGSRPPGNSAFPYVSKTYSETCSGIYVAPVSQLMSPSCHTFLVFHGSGRKQCACRPGWCGLLSLAVQAPAGSILPELPPFPRPWTGGRSAPQQGSNTAECGKGQTALRCTASWPAGDDKPMPAPPSSAPDYSGSSAGESGQGRSR